MARGFVMKRGEVWYAYWRDPSGKQRAKAIGSRKKDAERYLATIEADLATGGYRDVQDVTFATFAQRWLDDYAALQVKPSTLATYRSRVNGPMTARFGSMKLSAIATGAVQTYIADLMKAGLSPKTVRSHLVLLKGMLSCAVDWGHLKISPADKVKPPRIPHREMDFLTPAEVRAMLAAAEPQHYALLATAVMTGMRSGELLALQWSDLDWRSGTIRVRRSLYRGTFQEPKTARSVRTVALSPALADVLRQHQAASELNALDLIFASGQGTPLDPANVLKRILEPTLERAGLHRIRFHDLRHTFASLLINQGENLKYVQAQLGHASIQTTVDRYGHLMPDAHIGASRRLDATVFGDSPEDSAYKSLTRSGEEEQAPSYLRSGPAYSLVAGTGFEPMTFGL